MANRSDRDRQMPKNDASIIARPFVRQPIRENYQGLRSMNRTLNRMPEGCSPEVYFRKVRPYIFGFTDIIYEAAATNRALTAARRGRKARSSRRCWRPWASGTARRC